MQAKTKCPDGAWEERGVIGTRVEINGKKIVFFWRGAPVLETGFHASPSDGGLELKLKKNGLRYAGSASDYASVEKIRYADDKLEITTRFPITGDSTEVLSRTDHSRYGNYDVFLSVPKEWKGVWKSENGYSELVISEKEARLDGERHKICVLRSKNGAGTYLADLDPSIEGWHGFSRFEYLNGRFHTRMLVCDAPRSVEIVFTKGKNA